MTLPMVCPDDTVGMMGDPGLTTTYACEIGAVEPAVSIGGALIVAMCPYSHNSAKAGPETPLGEPPHSVLSAT